MASVKNKTVVIIVGPTAVGKTQVAIELAKHFKTEIISADSRQCFKEMSIGVAKPDEKQLQKVIHHFIASVSIHDEMNAAMFEKYVLKKTKQIFEKHDILVMVGGTGLYIKAFCEGLDDVPVIDPDVRKKIIKDYSENGLGWLQERVKKEDPEFYKSAEIKNPQRLMRALEVKESTDQSILFFHKGKKGKRDFNIIKIGLELPKEELHRNINDRIDQMMKSGLLEEVKKLLPDKDLNGLHTVGYTELFNYLEGKIPLIEAVDLIKKNTRQYAKRQMTWFNKDKEIKWFSPSQIAEIIKYAES